MNIFISYSHIDNGFALKLSSALEADGYDVFIDNKIPIGNNIYKDIGKGIAKADAVIVVISKILIKVILLQTRLYPCFLFWTKGECR